MIRMDLALTEGPTGGAIAHRADCPQVRVLADAGEPVMTMLGCEKPLPDDVPRHSCLDVPSDPQTAGSFGQLDLFDRAGAK
jgi:hypothetical protein